MTKTQIWVAAFLGMFILLFLLARFTRQEDNSSSKVTNPVPQTNMASDELSVADLMKKKRLYELPWARTSGYANGSPACQAF